MWAFELGQRAPEIAERLGVAKLRFAPGPLPTPSTEDVHEAVRPTATDERRAAGIAAVIEDENLRETVQKAVAFGLAAAAGDRSI